MAHVFFSPGERPLAWLIVSGFMARLVRNLRVYWVVVKELKLFKSL